MTYWKNRTVLVTGGAGFIGAHLVESLTQQGASVRVADNLERGKHVFGNDVDFRNEDLRDPVACERVCRDVEVVFHLASKVGGIGYYLSRPAEVLFDNLQIDANVLKASMKAGVARYMYAGSAHIYPIELQGSPDAPLIHEHQDIPAHPELSYGWAKLIGEKQIEYSIAQGTDLRASIVRIIGAYGPSQDVDLATGSAIPVFIRRAIEYPERKPYRLLGTGVETRSYCYVSDIVEGFLISVEKLAEKQLIGPLNLGCEDRISIGDLAREIIRISGKDIQIEFDTSHPTIIWGQALDCSLAKAVLDGWSPRVSLREGLERCYRQLERQLAAAAAK